MSASVTGVPAPKPHVSSCERATKWKCVCGCYSLLHQCDLLDAVLAPLPATKNGHTVGREIESLYGSAFRDLLDPHSGQHARRKWVNLSTPPGTKQAASQIEQRILDVTLNDVLTLAHREYRSSNWLRLGNALRAKQNWRGVASSLKASMAAATVVSADRTRGYFWSSMLAATIAAGDTAGAWPPLTQQIVAAAQTAPNGAPGTVDTITGEPVFARVLYPRTQRPNVIAELGVPTTVGIAANVISGALSTTAVPPHEARFVVQLVGVTVSPDLWDHPAAVRYLLLPAVNYLRQKGRAFSLDGHAAGSPRFVEDLIRDEVAAKWNSYGGRGFCW